MCGRDKLQCSHNCNYNPMLYKQKRSTCLKAMASCERDSPGRSPCLQGDHLQKHEPEPVTPRGEVPQLISWEGLSQP